MSPDSTQILPRTWSPEMLNEFHRFINSLLPISFVILEKDKSTTFFGKNISTSFWLRKTSHISYRGVIPVPGFENISVIFNPVKSLEEEFNNYIGYIEIANNYKEDTIPCPEIRGFIQEDLGIDTILMKCCLNQKCSIQKCPLSIFIWNNLIV